jgi:hypothetical protein
MSDGIRTQRRFGVMATFDNGDRQRLVQFRVSDAWDVVLDVMEQAIIEMETAFTNQSVGAGDAVIAAHHRKVQAAWQIFVQFQEKIEKECAIYAQETARPEPTAAPEDAAILQIVEPFNRYPTTGYPDGEQ